MPTDSPVKLSRETWRRVEPLLSQALELGDAARRPWLDSLEATQPELAPFVRKLLATHDRAERAGQLEAGPSLAPEAPANAFAEGERVGPFRLLRPLGRGGMGEVWLAEQADGRITRSVALKLPAAGLSGEVWRERFRRERDILARLEHPNIARLYDAGVTESGQAWLAMERIEGRTLPEDAEARSLDLRSRIALFRQVLEAVAHAHHHLVVHRDLKPANILVDGEGRVKLLDFGIAKLLDEAELAPESRELTRLGGRPMTLRYAAPEQAAGEAVTTATDIYSLGVVLYELLAGASPYAEVRQGRSFHEATLLQAEVSSPSSVAPTRPLGRALAGDLDAILLKALRREPAERYPSVERLDEDLARWLEHRPVSARAGTWRYLAARYLRRHRLPIATSAAIVVSLAAGLVAVDQQRRVAVAERERAQRHFESVRSLAGTLMFDLNAEIEKVPGTLKARKLLVSTSLEYLDRLAAESVRDRALALEVATAYRKVSEIIGQPNAANLGDYPATLAALTKARRILERLDRESPDDIAVLRELRTVTDHRASVLAQLGDPEAHAETVEYGRIAARVAGLPGAALEDRLAHYDARLTELNIAYAMRGENARARKELVPVVAELEALAREHPGNAAVRMALAAAYRWSAGAHSGSDRTPALMETAAAYSAKADAVLRELDALPSPPRGARVVLIDALLEQGDIAKDRGRRDEAERHIGEAIERARRLVREDPGNIQASRLLGYALGIGGTLAAARGDDARGIAFVREGLAAVEGAPAQARASRDMRDTLARLQLGLAEALMARAAKGRGTREERIAQYAEARRLLLAVVAFIRAVEAEKLGEVPESQKAALREAVAECERALARLGAPVAPA